MSDDRVAKALDSAMDWPEKSLDLQTPEGKARWPRPDTLEERVKRLEEEIAALRSKLGG